MLTDLESRLESNVFIVDLSLHRLLSLLKHSDYILAYRSFLSSAFFEEPK